MNRRHFIKTGLIFVPSYFAGEKLVAAVSVLPHRRKAFQPVAAGGGGSPQCCVIEFDGSTGRITHTALAGTLSTYSVAGWIMLQASSDNYGAITSNGATNGLWVRGSTRLLDWYNGGDNHNNTALTEGVWYHFAIVFNGAGGQWYLNGATDGTLGNPSRSTHTDIGNNGSSETFKGRLAQLAHFSIALSGAQVAALYNKSTTPDAIGSLDAYWKLDDVADGASGAGASFVDSSGGGRTGTGGAGGLTGRTATF